MDSPKSPAAPSSYSPWSLFQLLPSLRRGNSPESDNMSGAKDPEKAMEVVDDNNHDGGDSEEEIEDDSATGGDSAKVSAALLKNPAVMAALQGKLDGMIGSPSGYIQVGTHRVQAPFLIVPDECHCGYI